MSGSSINLKVVVRDGEGKVVDEQCKEGDIYLWNWGAWLASIIKLGFNASDATRYQVTDENGTVYEIGGYSSSTDYTKRATPMHCDWENSYKVAIGSSQATPSITDYKLGAEIMRVAGNVPQLVNDGDVIKIIFSATFSFDQEQICSETGLVFQIRRDTNNNTTNILVTRDVFTPVTVPAGGSITIQYEFQFNVATA